jgi:hypothetical protein
MRKYTKGLRGRLLRVVWRGGNPRHPPSVHGMDAQRCRHTMRGTVSDWAPEA